MNRNTLQNIIFEAINKFSKQLKKKDGSPKKLIRYIEVGRSWLLATVTEKALLD